MKGLGDTIEKFTKATGIKRIADRMGDCGCEKRKKKLNELFPYKNNQRISFTKNKKT